MTTLIEKYYYSIKQRLLQLKSQKTNKKVFMFHKIGNDTNDEFSITLYNFENLCNQTIEKKYCFTTFDMLKENDANKQVVLTFDDCFEDVYYKAYPYLKDENIPYYIFLCNEYLNKDGFLSFDMIKEMTNDSNCIVGWHFDQHIMVKDLNKDEFKSRLKEVNVIESIINKKITNFAFPYGSMYAVRKEHINVAEEYFDNVITTLACDYSTKFKNIIPRYNVNNKNSYKII